jgi:hypothetical protein
LKAVGIILNQTQIWEIEEIEARVAELERAVEAGKENEYDEVR